MDRGGRAAAGRVARAARAQPDDRPHRPQLDRQFGLVAAGLGITVVPRLAAPALPAGVTLVRVRGEHATVRRVLIAAPPLPARTRGRSRRRCTRPPPRELRRRRLVLGRLAAAGRVAWMDERLAARRDAPEPARWSQPRVRPWATVLTDAGDPVAALWLKAAGPGTRSRPGCTRCARGGPRPRTAADGARPRRGWMVLPDGGPTVGRRDGLAGALEPYGALQGALAPHVDELLAPGVLDMRPAAMAERFDEALESTGRRRSPGCAAGSPSGARDWPPPGPGEPRPQRPAPPGTCSPARSVLRLGQRVIAHPFASDARPAPDARAGRVRTANAYLHAFADLAPHRELVEDARAGTARVALASPARSCGSAR